MKIRVAASTLALFTAATFVRAVPTAEYASTLISFSSQWSSGSWSAAQVLGSPDTFGYGDIGSAWAPGPRNGSLEYITVGFATPTYAQGFVIRETYGNGFVYQVDALDQSNGLHTVWAGADLSLPGAPVDFSVMFPRTSFLVTGLKIYTNTDHNLSAWEEIDAILLWGDKDVSGGSSVPEGGSSVVMIGLALAGLACRGCGPKLRRLFSRAG